MEEKDINHLEWIFERMVYVHNENKNIDYMIRFNEIIEQLRQYNVVRQSEQLFCTMKGKGFCTYENKDGSCNMVDVNCKNHTPERAK